MLFYNAIASTLQARANCIAKGNKDWSDRHRDTIEAWVKEHAPSGSGFDAGTKFDMAESTPTRLVFNTAYHHMDQHGGYAGWTEHAVIVQQSLLGFDIRVTGTNRNDVKTYIAEAFHHLASVDPGVRAWVKAEEKANA